MMNRDTIKLYPALQRSVHVAEVAFSKGHLEAIFVPWDTPTRVVEMTEDGVDEYQEGFRSGAFDLQFERFPASIKEVVLLPRHNSSETFGHTRQLDNVAAGLHGVVQVLPSRHSDVESMIEQGVDSVSIEFRPLQRSPRTTPQDPVRWRDAAFLQAVALTATPAYEDAKVLAMRSEQEAIAVEAQALEARRAKLADLDAYLEAVKSSRWAI